MLTEAEMKDLAVGKATADMQREAAAMIDRLQRELVSARRRIRILNEYTEELEYHIGAWK